MQSLTTFLNSTLNHCVAPPTATQYRALLTRLLAVNLVISAGVPTALLLGASSPAGMYLLNISAGTILGLTAYIVVVTAFYLIRRE